MSTEPTARLASSPASAAPLGLAQALRARPAWLGVPLAAVLYVVAAPPHDWALAAWGAPGVLLASTRRGGVRAGVVAGLIFGVLAAWGVTGWVVGAASRYFDASPWRAAPTALALWLASGGVGFALLIGVWVALARRIAPAWRGVTAAWLWIAVEWLRSTVCTGLPWALLAHSQFRHPGVIRIADLGGAYAVSFVMVFVSVEVIEAIVTVAPTRNRQRRLFAPALLLAGMVAYGRQVPPAVAGPERSLVLVQGNVANELRWNRAFFAQTLAAYVRLTADATASAPDFVVWPENAVDFYRETEPALRSALRRVAVSARIGFLFGGPRLADERHARNAAHLLAPDGRDLAVYDKQHLVPFAEYTPWSSDTGGDGPVYGAGEPGAPLDAGATRLGVFICYEALFSPLVRDLVARGAGFLVTIANDAWLDAGDGAAPWQHFAATVFRAVETRRYLVRAASTGVTAVVAPDGTIVAQLPLHTAGALTVRVREADGLSPYVRWGDTWIAVAGALLGASVLLHRRWSVS